MTLAIIVASFSTGVQTAGSQNVVATEQQEKQIEERQTLFTEQELKALSYSAASKYGANAHELYTTIRCEAKERMIDGVLHYDATAKSDHPGEESYGLAQWHLPSKNTNFEGRAVTYAQATDPLYAVNLMAHYFANGKQRKWTCYRTHFA